MRVLRSAAYLLCATCLTFSLAWGESQAEQQARRHGNVAAEGWTVVVREATSPDEQADRVASFWVGLKNDEDQVRQLCIESVYFSIIATDNGVGGYVEGGPRTAPRACDAPADMRLVLPGETLFEFAMVPIPEWVVDGQEVAFLVRAVSRPSGEWHSREWVFERGARQLSVLGRGADR